MKHRILVALLLALPLASPAPAQDDTPLSDEMQEGFDLLEHGTRLLLQSLIAEMGPAWDELRQLLDEINAYHPPEILPNGDIIIRRKVPLVPDMEGDSEATEL